MNNNKFWKWAKCAGIRAIKTIAQTAVATIGTNVAWGDVNWKLVLSTSILAGFLSLLTSVAGLPEVEVEEQLNSIRKAKELNGQDENIK